MSRIIFKDITFKNIRSYGNNETTINLDGDNLSLIYGKNGTGKSTILESIYFNLFGKGLNKVKKSELINNINKKKLLTTLTFSINNKDYKVVRGIKPEVFEIYEIVNGDDKLLEQDSTVHLYQQRLVDIIGIDDKTFYQMVLLNSKYSKFLELTTPERRSLVENILCLDIFKSMNEKLKDINKSIQDNLNTCNNDLSKAQSDHDRVSMYISDQKHLIDTTEETFDVKLLNEAEADLDKKKQELKDLQVLLDETKKTIDSSNLNSEITTLNERINKGNSFKSSNVTEIGYQQKMLDFLEENDTCPTCKQTISDDFKRTKMDELTETINSLRKKGDGIEAQIVKLTLDKGLKVKQNDELKSRYNDEYQKMVPTSLSVTVTENDIDKLKSTRERINSKDERNNVLNERIKQYTQEVKDITNQIDNCKKLKTGLDQKILIVDKMKKYLSDKGIKTIIINKYVNIINERVNYFLNKLNFSCIFEIDENFSDRIIRKGCEMNYSQLSTGQKCRIDLSLLFAWLYVGKVNNTISTNILFIDEVLDQGLDEEGINNVLNLTREIEDKNIFLISHRNLNEEQFNKVYEITMNSQEFSTIKES